MKTTLPVALSAALVLVVGCSKQNVPKPSPDKPVTSTKTDLELFQGTWEVVSLGGNGKTSPQEKIRDLKVIINGDDYTMKKGEKTLENATLKIDPVKEPKTIDLAFTLGEVKGQTLPGIYAWEGETLKLCLTEAGKPRPTEIANKAGVRHDLWVLRRANR